MVLVVALLQRHRHHHHHRVMVMVLVVVVPHLVDDRHHGNQIKIFVSIQMREPLPNVCHYQSN
jgi:hypothetical protein